MKPAVAGQIPVQEKQHDNVSGPGAPAEADPPPATDAAAETEALAATAISPCDNSQEQQLVEAATTASVSASAEAVAATVTTSGDESEKQQQVGAAATATATAEAAGVAIDSGDEFKQKQGQAVEAAAGAADAAVAAKAEATAIATSAQALARATNSPGDESGQQKQQKVEESATSSATAAPVAPAAAAAGAERFQACSSLPVCDGSDEGSSGLASSVLSSLLSGVLRQLLPWVLPFALKGAAAADIQVKLAQRQLCLRGVALQSQELTTITGAPFQLLHCSIGVIELRLGGQEKPSAVAAVGGAASGVETPDGGAHTTSDVSPAEAAAAATAAAEVLRNEGASSLALSVKDVVVVLAPTSATEWSRQQLLDLALQRRRSLLDSTDSKLQQQQQQQNGGFSVTASGLVSQWIDKHIEWASVQVTNLHLRVEAVLPSTSSSNSNSGCFPFALGFTLRQLHIRTLPAEQFDAASRSLVATESQRGESHQHKHLQPSGTGAAQGKSSSNSSSSKGSVCSVFDIKDFSVYTHEELLLLAPHTRRASETTTRLNAIVTEQQQKHQQQQQDAAEHKQHRRRSLVATVPAEGPSEQHQASSSNSNSSTSLLAPVTVQLFLRKNPVIGVPTSSRSSSSSNSSSSMAPAEGSGNDGGAASTSGLTVASIATAAAAENDRVLSAAYMAEVVSGCLDISLSPVAVRGIRLLAANAEQHRQAVETAEAVLSLVRPFTPSCTVQGNAPIWWRFAIRAVRRLQRSSNGGDAMEPPEGGITVEESLKLRLVLEKAATYRRLRLLELQSVATQQQQNLLLQLRDSLPLPQLLRAHAEAQEGFLQQQEAAAAAKSWSRWLPMWRGAKHNEGAEAAEAAAGAGAADKRPRLPPLSLQKLLEQHQRQRKEQQEERQPAQQESPAEGEQFVDLDDFFDATSQPGTARFKRGGGTARICIGANEGSPAALLQAAADALEDKKAQEKAHQLAVLGSAAEATSEEGNPGTALLKEVDDGPGGDQSTVAPVAKRISTSSDKSESGSSESEDTDAFEDCWDPQTPRQPRHSPSALDVSTSAAAEPAATAAEKAETAPKTVLTAAAPVCEDQAVLQHISPRPQQPVYALSVSVHLRAASIACTLDPPDRQHLHCLPLQQTPQQQQGERQLDGVLLLCSVGCLRLDCLVGALRVDGSVSVGRMGICHKRGGQQQLPQQLVYRHPSAESEPLLLLHVLRGPDTSTTHNESNSTEKNCNASGQSAAMQSSQQQGRHKEGDAAVRDGGTSLLLKISRIICFLDPDALRDASLVGRCFGAAAAEAAAVAAEASQACSFLLFRRNVTTSHSGAQGGAGAEYPSKPHGRLALRQRVLLLSPKRQQQLLDSAKLRYAVCVEAPTLIAPTAEGRAVLCHLGELRVCSALRGKSREGSSCSSAPGAGATHDLAFEDPVFHSRYFELFKPGSTGAAAAAATAVPTSAGATTCRMKHVNLRTHHGVLLRDSHVFLHPCLDRLMRGVSQGQQRSGRTLSSSGSSRHTSTSRRQSRREINARYRWQSQQSLKEGGRKLWRRSSIDTADPAACEKWDFWDHTTATPVLFPSELVGAIEVEHVDVFDPGELLLPLHPSVQKSRKTAAFSGSCAVKDPLKEKEEARTKSARGQQISNQQQTQQPASEQQVTHRSEVYVHVLGKCDQLRVSVSRSTCVALSSAADAIKAAVAEGAPSQPSRSTSAGCSGAPAPDVFSTQASSNSINTNIPNDSNGSIIPVFVTAELEWQQMAAYIHCLDSGLAVEASADFSRASPDCDFTQRDSDADVLLLQACALSVRLNSSSSSTSAQLMMKQLLLEQPSLPEESLNRYILRLPSHGTKLEALTVAAANFSGVAVGSPSGGAASGGVPDAGASLVLHVSTSSHSAASAGNANVIASVHFLRTMALNFRPTPLTCLLDFAKNPSWNRNSSKSHSVTRHGGNVARGDALEISREAADSFDGSDAKPGTPCRREAGEKKAAEGDVETGEAFGYNDPLMRDMQVEFQSVDFLWTTRDTDLHLATATLEGASIRMQLYRHTTLFSAGVKNFTMHFVVGDTDTARGKSKTRTRRSRPIPTRQISPLRVKRASLVDTPRKRTVLRTTEIMGLIPGNSCAINVVLESIHPLSPRFTGLSSRLEVEMGAVRLVYLHPKFWRLFDWMIDDFIGTLTSSPLPEPPRGEVQGGHEDQKKGSVSTETTGKPIQRSPSLEELAYHTAVAKEESSKGVGACATPEGLENATVERKQVLVPNEGLRRIFILADAGRKIMGLNSIMTWVEKQQHVPSAAARERGSMRERLVLPQSLPCSVFSYEIWIDSPRLFLPATCSPTGVQSQFWPPLSGTHCSCGTESRYVGGNNAEGGCGVPCSTCDCNGQSEADRSEVVILLDTFMVSNSWCLSKRYGVVEGINVSFKGTRAFAKVQGSPQDFTAPIAEPHQNEKLGIAGRQPFCRRCRRASGSESPSSGASECTDLEAQSETAYGRYLFGSVDMVVHMYRPALFKTPSSWLRVEVGLLPMRLDAQTLKLMFDILDGNITARDPDVDATKAGGISTPTKATAPHAASTVAAVKNSRFDVEASAQREFPWLVQRLRTQQILQGLLEPQLDFVELLEEWGQETFLLELIAQGVHLAFCEPPLQQQIAALRKRCTSLKYKLNALRKQHHTPRNTSVSQSNDSRQDDRNAMQQAQMPFLLFHATRLRVQLRSLQLPPAKAQNVGLLLCDGEMGNHVQKLVAAPPVTGTFIGMRVGSSTLFSPEFAHPFAIIFTDSCVPLGLLQQQLEPVQESMRQANADAVASAVAASTVHPCKVAPVSQQLGEASSKGIRQNLQQPHWQEVHGKQQKQGEHQQQHKEHPLVNALSAPWIDPLQLVDSKEDSADECSDDGSVVGATGRGPRGSKNAKRSPLEAASPGSTEATPNDIDYIVLFPSADGSIRGRQLGQHRRLGSAVPAALSLPQPTELMVFYKSASAVPVTPLPSNSGGVLEECEGLTTREKLHILHRLLHQRPQQGKQSRIAVSSWKPRCVLSLPLLARITAFFSHDDVPCSTHLATSAKKFGKDFESLDATHGASDASRRSSQLTPQDDRALQHLSSAADAADQASSLLTEDRVAYLSVSELRRRSCSSGGSSHTHRRSAASRSSSIGAASFVNKTGSHFLEKGNSNGEALSTNMALNSRQRTINAGVVEAGPESGDIARFGTKTLDMCRLSYTSAKRFAAALSSSKRPVQQHMTGQSTSDESEATRGSSSSSDGNPRGRYAASAALQQHTRPPVLLTSSKASLHLSEASLVLPENSNNVGSSAVLLRGSVDLRRRADAVQDPLGLGGVSNDSVEVQRLYTRPRRCGQVNSKKNSWSIQMEKSIFSTADDERATQQPQLGPRGAAFINTLDSMEDTFCPGFQAVDFLLQRAAVTCLRNSGPLQQMEVAAADLHWKRKQLELRHHRTLRRTGSSSSKSANVPTTTCTAGDSIRPQAAAAAKQPVPEGLTRAATMAEVAAFRGNVDSDEFLHQGDCAASFISYVAGASLKAKEAGPAADAYSIGRVICSDLRAHLSYCILPPAAPCARQASGSLGSQSAASDMATTTSERRRNPHQVHNSDAGCCCCLTKTPSTNGFSDTADGLCDCCCHQPQDDTTLHLSPCAFELSYLDCLLICRCAAEQTRQLEAQQQWQQHQRTRLVQYFQRSVALHQKLLLRQRYVKGQDQGGSVATGAPYKSHLPGMPRCAFLTNRSIVHQRLGEPAPPAESVAADSAAAPAPSEAMQARPVYPKQRRVLANLPLLRVTLLNDHLDCLQAPLLQLLLLKCHLSRAFSVLPPFPEEAQEVKPQSQQLSPQVAAVTFVEASILLWALNPLAVAFEPVIESLPLVLVVREAPYPLMRYAYTPTCNDDGLAFVATHSVINKDVEEVYWDSPCTASFSGQLAGPTSSLETALVEGERSANPRSLPHSSSGSSGKEEVNSSASASTVIFRFGRSAADFEASAFHRAEDASQAASSHHLPAPSPDAPYQKGPGHAHRMSSVGSRRNSSSWHWRSKSVLQKRSHNNRRPSDVGTASSPAPGRYMGVLLSCPEGKSIEANMSPLLIQSVLGSLVKWQCDFARHMQEETASAAFAKSSAAVHRTIAQAQNQRSQKDLTSFQPQHNWGQQPGPPPVADVLLDSAAGGPQAAEQERQLRGAAAGRPDLNALKSDDDSDRLQKLSSRSLGMVSPASSASLDRGRRPNKQLHLEAHQERGFAAAVYDEATIVESTTQNVQEEHRLLQEAAGTRRGKLFIPYHIVNQTGLYLGVQLLPPAAVPSAEADDAPADAARRATAAAECGLPSTLRLCRRHNKEKEVEDASSSEDSSSSTSEAQMRRSLAAAPIFWEFGPALQKLPAVPASAPAAGVPSSAKYTVSCPPTPSSRNMTAATANQLSARDDAPKWDWLRPSEERALTQMRVAIGAASAAHVALQLVDTVQGVANVQRLLATARDLGEGKDNSELGHSSSRRWRLRLPVPLDRAGVYIQPLTDTKTFLATTLAVPGQVSTRQAFVVCRLVAEAGTKRLLVQSQVVLCSSCSAPLEILILPPSQAPSLGPQEHQQMQNIERKEGQGFKSLRLNPGKSMAVPVDRTDCSDDMGHVSRWYFACLCSVVCAAVCFTGRLRVRPLQTNYTYTWSRDLSLSMVWKVLEGAQKQQSGKSQSRFPDRGTSRGNVPSIDLLRCCPSGNGEHPESSAEAGLAIKQDKGTNEKERQVDYHMVVLYRLERLFHSSFSCVQLNVSFEAPLRLASNIPFPIRPLGSPTSFGCLVTLCFRYRVHSPLVLKGAETPPEDSEGLLQLNDRHQIHSFPLAGVAFLSLSLAEDRWSSRTQIQPRPLQRRRLSSAAPAGASTGAPPVPTSSRGQDAGDHMGSDAARHGHAEATGETLGGETVVEVECMDSRYRVAKLWVVFCETDGGAPSLLIHSPVWLVSYVHWSLKHHQHHLRQNYKREGATGKAKALPLVEFTAVHGNGPGNLGWAMQAVSAAAAAVDLQRDAVQQQPSHLAKFGASSVGSPVDDCDGEIRLLDFTASSIRVEAEGIGQSQELDIWGDFPKTLQVEPRPSTQSGFVSTYSHSSPGAPSGFAHPGTGQFGSNLSPHNSRPRKSEMAEEYGDCSLPGRGSSGPCLDLVAAMHEAPMPLLRPVLLLTLAPMYTITSRCDFPVRVRQATPGPCCSSGSNSKEEGFDFVVDLSPHQTQPLVWLNGEGIRAIQLQYVLPTLCWLQHGCSRSASLGGIDDTALDLWSAWSGYSPVSFSGEEWCLRLPTVGLFTLSPPGTNSQGGNERGGDILGSLVQRQQQSRAVVKPLHLMAALLRRGVSVDPSVKPPAALSHPSDACGRRAFAPSGCHSLRLETEEGAASSINLVLQKERFDMRDAISVCNDTPLPLLLRQCRHTDIPPPDSTPAAAARRPSAVPEAPTLGVESVTSAVAELWGAAMQNMHEEQNQHGYDEISGLVRSESLYGGRTAASLETDPDRSLQLLSMLLDKQQRTEQEQRRRREKGAPLSHASNTVCISLLPHEEAVHLQLVRLTKIAEAVAAESDPLREQQQHQQSSVGDGSSSSSCARCSWCRFESAAALELQMMEQRAWKASHGREAERSPPEAWPAPQLVLPGETVLFAWDDYRSLPCIELSYYPWLQHKQREHEAGEDYICSSSSRAHVSDLLMLDTPFVACIPLHPSVRGVVPLTSLPSSCWLMFRVVRSAGRLRLQVVPAGDLLGIRSFLPSSSAAQMEQQQQASCIQTSAGSHAPDPANAIPAPGAAPSTWGLEEAEHIPLSPEDVDVNSLLVLPRYFQLSIVKQELSVTCSRNSRRNSSKESRVPPWAFASMCRFSETIVGSYAPDRKSAELTTAASTRQGGPEEATAVLPLRPTPDPPMFELRVEVPRMQLSVLTQGAVTDPLSRQTFRLPEELLLVTFEGLAASHICSPFHSATACRVQEVQVDSMYSQSYYPVLMQRAPHLPNEAGQPPDNNWLHVPQPSGSKQQQEQQQQQASSSRRGTAQRGTSLEPGSAEEALVELVVQQRHPHGGTRQEDVVLVDKFSIALRPVSVKTDLNSFYVATEAFSCWRAAWAAATQSAMLQQQGTTRRATARMATGAGRHPTVTTLRSAATAPFALREPLVVDDQGKGENLEKHYSQLSGIEWVCNGNISWRFPVSLFVTPNPDAGFGGAPSPLLLRATLVREQEQKGQQQYSKQQKPKRYVFRAFSIAPTSIVLSFKADTGGSSSALRRSVVTLSSLEDACFQVDGLSMTGRLLAAKLKELQQQQQPQLQQSLRLLAQLQRNHTQPALSLRDVSRVLGHFYQQQLLSRLSKVIISVDLLGNPALSFAHLQAGVYALARQPLEAAEAGEDVFEGMMRGAEDFLKHTGYGFFGGISRMAGVASDSLGALACDEVYVHARKQQGRHKARNVEEGLQQGVEALGRALAGGITGLVEEPVRGAAEGGFEGMLRGAGRGIAGFLVKPLTGVLDLAQKTAEAIKDASQLEGYQRPRQRLPRLLLGTSRLLIAYDSEAAEAKAILTEAEGQYWANLPVLFFALDHRLQFLTVLTESHVLLFKVHARGPAELQFLAPISCLLAVGRCSICNPSSSASKATKERYVVVLQLRRLGDSKVCYQQLIYANNRLQRHIIHSLKQLLLHLQMRGPSLSAEEPKPSDSPPEQLAAEANEEAFDEPDDELEEFDEIGGDVPVDAEVKQWSEDWDAAGWDDEDPDNEFLERLQRELETFKTNYANKTQTRKA